MKANALVIFFSLLVIGSAIGLALFVLVD